MLARDIGHSINKQDGRLTDAAAGRLRVDEVASSIPGAATEARLIATPESAIVARDPLGRGKVGGADALVA